MNYISLDLETLSKDVEKRPAITQMSAVRFCRGNGEVNVFEESLFAANIALDDQANRDIDRQTLEWYGSAHHLYDRKAGLPVSLYDALKRLKKWVGLNHDWPVVCGKHYDCPIFLELQRRSRIHIWSYRDFLDHRTLRHGLERVTFAPEFAREYPEHTARGDAVRQAYELQYQEIAPLQTPLPSYGQFLRRVMARAIDDGPLPLDAIERALGCDRDQAKQLCERLGFDPETGKDLWSLEGRR